jgi:oxygen-independent coproporphyrinogen-3 oxidase
MTPATQKAHPIDIATEIGETMMMGLRLTREGVSQKAFYRRFRQAIKNVYGTQVERLTSMGLLEWAGKNQDILRLTSKGRFLGNRVFMEFL